MSYFESLFQSVTGAEDGSNNDLVPLTVEEQVEIVIDKELADLETTVALEQANVDKIEINIEALEEKVEDLEEQIDGMESMLSGKTDFNAALFQNYYDRGSKIVAKFGVKVEHQGAESFAEKSTAEMNALAGMLSFKETAGKAWGAVKTFFINLYNSFVNLFVGLFDTLKGVARKGETYKSRIQNLADDKFKEEIKLGGWNAYTNLGVEKDPASVTSKISSAVLSLLKAVGDVLTKNSGNVSDADSYKSTLNSLLTEADKKSSTSNENNETIVANFGGIKFTVVLPVSSPKNMEVAVANTSASFVVGEGAKTDGTIKTPYNKAGLVKACDKIISESKELQVSKFDAAALKVSRDKAVAAIEVYSNKESKEEDSKKVAAIKASHKAGLKISNTVLKYSTKRLQAGLGMIGAHF